MNQSWLRSIVFLGLLTLLGSVSVCNAQEEPESELVKVEFMAKGLEGIRGGYRPVRAKLSSEIGDSVKVPEGLKNPKYAEIEINRQKWGVIRDSLGGGKYRVIVDTDGDGDFTNEKEVKVTSLPRGSGGRFSCNVVVKENQKGLVKFYWLKRLPGNLLYYSDYGHKATFQLDGKKFELVVEDVKDGGKVQFDVNGDGKRSRNYESVTVGKPFNLTGTTYVLSIDKAKKLSLAKSDKTLPQSPQAPNFKLGKKTIEFEAESIAGDAIKFPSSYKGKIVMLDFWATWCGPCIREIPNMKAAYNGWHQYGFDILGVSFDQEGAEEKLAEFRKSREIPWPQIYEGKGWNTKLGKLHDVSGIPFVLVVDGDTGEILGTSRQARGPGLAKFIGKQLLAKGLISKDQFTEKMSLIEEQIAEMKAEAKRKYEEAMKKRKEAQKKREAKK